MAARRDGDPFDAALGRARASRVKEVVQLQAENGLDIVNDGEYTKRSWQTYSRGRLSGLEFRPLREGEDPSYGSITARESRYFPEFFAQGLAGFGRRRRRAAQPTREGVFCVGPLTYIGEQEYQRDIALIKEAAQGVRSKSWC